MTRDEAVQQATKGPTPLETINIEGPGGLREIAQALGIAVITGQKKAMIIHNIRTAITALPATPVAPPAPVTPTPIAPTPLVVNTPKPKSKIEESADRILGWFRK